MEKYVYMIGIDPDYWTTDDDKACEQYKVDCKGYYELGTDEGFILVGTLKNLKKLLEDYFGVAIVDEYLTEYDYFDFEDGEWIIGGWDESKKSVRKSIKESKDRENDIKVSIPSNKEIITFFKPMEHGLSDAQLMNLNSTVGGNWAKIDEPYFEESGYMYINAKSNSHSYMQYDFAKVISIDIDWMNKYIYFYTKGDILGLHFYYLSEEEFEILIYGDEHIDGIVTRFGK